MNKVFLNRQTVLFQPLNMAVDITKLPRLSSHVQEPGTTERITIQPDSCGFTASETRVRYNGWIASETFRKRVHHPLSGAHYIPHTSR